MSNTSQNLKYLYYMFILFWISTTAFQITEMFFDGFDHWYASIAIFSSWLILCMFSYMVKRQIREEREIIQAQHVERMEEMKKQWEELKETTKQSV